MSSTMSKDLKVMRGEPCKHLEREHSRQQEQQVQRPWGGSAPGMSEQQQNGG